MRLIPTAIAFIALPVAAFAASSSSPPPVQSNNFNGFYAGIMAGYENMNEAGNDVGQGAFTGLSDSGSLGASGVSGGIFAGYGERINHDYYLGAEAEADLDSAETKARIASGSSYLYTDTAHNYDYGASLRAGFFPTTNTLLYGRLGVVEGEFESKAVNTNYSVPGLRLGLGSETAIAPNMTVRADWAYTIYDTHTYSDANQIANDKFTSNTFRVGLAYSF